MNALERHDQEIRSVMIRMELAMDKGAWYIVYDLHKYLHNLLMQRKEYTARWNQQKK